MEFVFFDIREVSAFLVSPLVSSLPLLLFFAPPSSPLFLGKLMPEEGIGTGFALYAVFFTATILGFAVEVCVALPVYLLLRVKNRVGKKNIYLLAALCGTFASYFVRETESFRQPGLDFFAKSLASPLFGISCGYCAGMMFWLLVQEATVTTLRAGKKSKE